MVPGHAAPRGGFPSAVPVILIFWLAGLASALRLPVAVDGGVDAFRLTPPTILGIVLMVVGFGISLAAQYIVACIIVRGVSKVRNT
jgi:hypothetical protein